MALPDNLADLFGPQNNQPNLPQVTTLQNLGYKITWDAMNDETAPPELQSQLADLYDESRYRPSRALAERIRILVQRYPEIPILKNYLMTTYTLTGQKSRADEVLNQTVKQHPRYLLGLVNKANQLLVNDDTAAVEALFGGPPVDIALFYPERSTFHASEVGHFTFAAFNYYIAKGDPEAAENRLRFLRDLGYHTKDQLRTMKNQLDIAHIKNNMARMQEGLANAITVDGYFRADDQQTIEPPVFTHPEIQWLYAFGFRERPLPAEYRDIILSLPRPSLTADLSKVLLDTIYRNTYFQDQDWEDTQHNFAGHALLLATELQANECFDAVLETLRQDTEFQEFWWGDYVNDFYEPYFRRLLPSHSDAMKAFLLEPDVNGYAKSAVSNAYAQEVMANTALKPIAQTWYTDVLTYFIDHANDEHLLDNDLLGFLIGDILDIELPDLLPLIRVAYTHNLVSEQIVGDLGDVERQFIKRSFPPDRHPLRSLAEQYEYLHDPAAYHKAHPDSEREDVSDDYWEDFDEKESEWDSLYEDEEGAPNGALFPSQQRPFLPLSMQPVIKEPKPARNDKVSVRYTDGKVVKDVKYKKVEMDVEAGKCVLL